MANLSITNVCNKSCAYCFANDTRNESGRSFMSIELYEKALDYLVRSGIPQARLLGGEPTLHPDFKRFVSMALDQGLNIMLFTNGLMSLEKLKFLSTLPESRLAILLNTIHPAELNPKGCAQQKEMMIKLGSVTIPGVNIYHSGLGLDYLLDYIEIYGLRKEVRLGISHAMLSSKNQFLHPKDYQKVGHNIALFKMKAKERGISLRLDCGFVPCMFPEEYRDQLSEELKVAGTCCHPIIDLLTNGTFIACYPLNDFLKIEIHEDSVASDVVKSFDQALSPYGNLGIFSYCTACSLFKDKCNGGCISFRIQRLRSGCNN